MTSEEKNLEDFFLVWLDANVNNLKMNIDVQQQLRKCIRNPQTFDDINKCELYIRFVPVDQRVVLIVNNNLGQEIVPRIHQLQQVSSIYLYDTNQEAKEEWTKDYVKIKGVIKELDVLIAQIQMDHSRRGIKKVDEPLVFNIFNMSSTSEQSTTGLNGQFVHSQLLIDCLLRLKAIPTDKDELISLSEKQFKDNKTELAILHEFQENYSPDRALWWYTRESFLYRQLNKALRVQNIDSLFIFRFFIRDIEKQLEEHRCSSPMRVFRGQLMSNEEVEVLQDSIGQLISMNSFLSTSIDRRLALSFLYSSNASNNIQRVLFEIDIDPRSEGTRPFANITSLSYFPGEDEVLLMLGSIFRLISIDHNDRGIWILRLTLCSNSDPDLQAVFDHMKDEYGNGETTLLSVGIILTRMGKYDDAEKYYRRLLKEIPSDHEDIGACYHNLGNLFDDKGDYETSLSWHHKALETMIRTLSPVDSRIGTSHNSIAAVAAKMGDYDQALESFVKAFKIWRESLGEDHPNIGQCLSNMAGIYQIYDRKLEALDCLQKALIIYQKHLPTNHPQMGDLHNNIGLTHYILAQYDLAFEHLNISLKIKEKCLPPQHPDIAMTHFNLGLVYESQDQLQEALSYLEKAITIYRHVLYPTHPTIIKVEQIIERVSDKSKIA
ncbi:unnamed protein product [Adineta steineri]|uniref:ADP ribosyltransferase domain-containing protein n=2 Tax=Adineta steineri TaxID=433720 RepID=A0A815BG84_9BILA|nr:unnamed protein product [Adineta steineri]